MRRDALAVFAVALLIRIVFCAFVSPRLGDTFSQGDGYDTIAHNLVEGRGYTLDGASAAPLRLPLVPLIYAAIFALFGPVAWPWQLVQTALDAATCALVFLLGREHSARIGAFAAASFCALHPTMILYTARPMTETVYVFLVVAFVALLVRPSGRGIAAGLVLGAQLLVKSTALVSCVALLPPLWRGRRTAVRNALLSAAAVVLPWVSWNLVSFGQPHLLAATGGLTLYHGLYISEHVGWMTPTGELNRPAELALWREWIGRGVAIDAPVAQRDAIARRVALDLIASRPLHTAALWSRNLLLTWYLTRGRTSMLVHLVAHAALLAAAALGAARLWRDGGAARELAVTLVLLIAAYTTVHAVIHPAVRYILPAIPLAAVLAARAFGAREAGES